MTLEEVSIVKKKESINGSKNVLIGHRSHIEHNEKQKRVGDD
jgi:hypothetical protein